MDGIIGPIEDRLRRIEQHLFGPAMSMVADSAQKHLDENPPDRVEVAPAQTLHPARMPATPGLPIAPYDPNVHQDDETDAAIAAERGDTSFIPSSDDGDPTLNEDGTTKRRRRKSDDSDSQAVT